MCLHIFSRFFTDSIRLGHAFLKIKTENLGLLIGVFGTLTFSVFINMIGFKSTILLSFSATAAFLFISGLFLLVNLSPAFGSYFPFLILANFDWFMDTESKGFYIVGS